MLAYLGTACSAGHQVGLFKESVRSFLSGVPHVRVARPCRIAHAIDGSDQHLPSSKFSVEPLRTRCDSKRIRPTLPFPSKSRGRTEVSTARDAMEPNFLPEHQFCTAIVVNRTHGDLIACSLDHGHSGRHQYIGDDGALLAEWKPSTSCNERSIPTRMP